MNGLPAGWPYAVLWLAVLGVTYGVRPKIGVWLAFITVFAVVAYMYRNKKGFFAKL